MARTVVVYESMYGNTEQVAKAIAEELGGDVGPFEVSAAPSELGDCALVVVGGPTHAFSMSRASTREDAERKASTGQVISRDMGVREWLESLGEGALPDCAAAFDTHMDHPRIFKHAGSAAGAIEKRLRKRGATLVAPAEHFWVEDTEGPLREGELARAREWAGSLRRAHENVRLSTHK